MTAVTVTVLGLGYLSSSKKTNDEVNEDKKQLPKIHSKTYYISETFKKQ